MTFFSCRFRIKDVPSGAEVLAALRRWWWLCVVIAGAIAGTTFGVVQKLHADHAPPPVTTGFLQVDSAPPRAAIQVDGREVGRTPAHLDVGPGEHSVRVAAAGYLDASYQVAITIGATVALRTDLWLAQPRATQLLPPLPGAAVTGADFLEDGRVALSVTVPPGDERQLWIIGPRAEQRRIGPPLARGSATVSADGSRVAYLGSPANSFGAAQPPTELWVAGADGQQGVRRYALPQQSTGTDQLVDVAWAPDGQHLLGRTSSKRSA